MSSIPKDSTSALATDRGKRPSGAVTASFRRRCPLAPPARPVGGYDVVRITLAIVLITSAALKGYQLTTSPVAETGLLTSRWFLIAVVEFEFAFGTWLLAGLFPNQTRCASVASFAAFCAVSLMRALSGEASCGCFGSVAISPWLSGALDVAAVIALCAVTPCSEQTGQRGASLRRLAMPAITSTVIGIPAAITMAAFRPAAVTDNGDVVG
ncbi:MAG: MauE/DoxX family redox-associated membrane protein, partial [Pirellulales bacterium]